jgi:hypothetical protein
MLMTPMFAEAHCITNENYSYYTKLLMECKFFGPKRWSDEPLMVGRTAMYGPHSKGPFVG